MAIERFLLLDDNSGNQLFFEMLLKEIGANKIISSPTGDDALLQADEQHAQFFICAWELNGMPGTVFIQKIRQKRKRMFAPCLIYSKRMSDEDVRLTRELGFADILSMPFDRQAVKETVERIVKAENNLDPRESHLRKIEMYAPEQPMEAFKLFNDSMFKPGALQTRAYLSAALVFMNLAKYDKAEKCINDALKNVPDSVKGLQLQAKLLSRQGKHAEAILILEKMVSNSPKNLGTKVSLGTAYMEGQRLDDAKRIFDEVIGIDGGNQDCKDQLATIAVQEGNFGLAEQLIAETENGNELARAFNNLAISQVAKGDFDKGVTTYSNAMRMLADKARLHLLHYNLGLAYRKKGSLEESFQEFSKSYLAEPTYEKAYAAIARTAQELKAAGKKPDAKLVTQIKALRQSAPPKSA